MKNKTLVLLVGPPGVGKSTLAKQLYDTYTYISQDAQGKAHLQKFMEAMEREENVIVDRMGFSVEQRKRYLLPAVGRGYKTEIIVIHEPREVCLQRCLERKDHETIKDEKSARSAINLFFSKYERPTLDEAHEVNFIYPQLVVKPKAIWSDLDGTLCNVEHRRHLVRGEGRKDWQGFFKEMINDTVNKPVMETLEKFSNTHKIVYCSGRPDNWRKETETWLENNGAPLGPLFMRPRNDSRPDNIIKEVLLDFEILTKFQIDFCLDDRDQVVKMLRSRGLTVFQVADGDF